MRGMDVRDVGGAGSVSVGSAPIRIVLFDRQRAVGAALAAALQTEPDISVVDVVGDEAGATTALSDGEVDVLLVDLREQSQSGVAVIQRLRASLRQLRVVALTTVDDPRLAAAAIRAGVSSWVPRELGIDHLVAVLRRVATGESWLPPALLYQVLDELAGPELPDDGQKVVGLSRREQEILRCMVAGLDRQAIAERLAVSRHTVRTHIQNLLAKLGVHSGLEAVAIGVRAGLALPTSPSG